MRQHKKRRHINTKNFKHLRDKKREAKVEGMKTKT
jgi:hypothetical protein